MDDALEFLRVRKAAYQMTFSGPHGARVLDDLTRFCRAEETCFHENPRVHAALEGRREVFLRIREHLDRNIEELAALYRAVAPATEGDRDDD